MALVGQLINQRAESGPRACCFFHQQRVEFVDVSSFASLGPDVRRRFATPNPTRSAHLALRSRFKSGNRRFAASSATTSAREFASMWWKAILFCLMADWPASFKCDFTLIKSVTPLRSSINWKRIDHKSPLGPCTRSPVCAMPLVTYSRRSNLDVRLPIDFAENLDSSPKFGSWNRLFAGHLTSQITSLLQSERCVVANEHVKSGHSKCDLSQCLVSLPTSP